LAHPQSHETQLPTMPIQNLRYDHEEYEERIYGRPKGDPPEMFLS